MVKFKIQPLGNRILVQRQETETKKGGILLPESAQQKPKQGKVLAVGPGSVDAKGRKIPVEVAVGDSVLFSSYGGTEYKMNDQDFLILSQDDVLAVFN